jgi:hypothetical protein
MKRVLFVRNDNSNIRVILNKRRLSLKKIISLVIILFFILGCGEDKGKIRIWLVDAPPPQDVQHIYLTVIAVGVRNAEGKATTLQYDPYRVDIVELSGGLAATLTYNYRTGSYFADIEPGDYTSVLLALAQINSVVRDNVEDSLLISNDTIQYELEEDFTVIPNQNLTIIIDFDASKSINWESSPYELTPRFRIFESSIAGFVQGIVKDTSGDTLKYAICTAANALDTFTTLSDSTSSDTTNPHTYQLTIPEGTYNISVSAEGYTTADTTYTGVNVTRGSVLTGYNFTLE